MAATTITNPIPSDPHSNDYIIQEELVQLYSKMTEVTTAYENYLHDSSKIGELNTKVQNLNTFLQSGTTPILQHLKPIDFDMNHEQLIQTSKEIADTRNKYDVLLNELYNNDQLFDKSHPNIDINIISGILWTTLISSVIYLLYKFFK